MFYIKDQYPTTALQNNLERVIAQYQNFNFDSTVKCEMLIQMVKFSNFD